MAKMNNKVKTIIICVLLFVIWAGLSVYRTLGRNMDWFEQVNVVEEASAREEIKTTDKGEFTYALAWSKYGDNWVCVNIDGYAEIVLDKGYTEVTDFCNSIYAMVKDENGIKSIIDRAGNLKLCEYSYVCDEILTNDFHANLVVATQKVTENGEEKVGYGLIDSSLGWCKAPSSENKYLTEFTKGIDGGVLTNEKGDKLYFSRIDVVVENVDEFLFYDDQIAMYRKGTDIYLIDKSGEHERVSMKNIAKAGEWTEGTIYCELTDGRKVFNDINGKEILDVTSLNVVNSPRFIDGYAGIVMQTEEGTKYTVIDTKGKIMFEPRMGAVCDTLTSKAYRVETLSESSISPTKIEVINEKGEKLFEANSSITYFTNGYAIKDNETYVRTDGTELVITKDVNK